MSVVCIGSATVDLYVRAAGATIMEWHTPLARRRYMVLDYGGKMNVPFYEESVGGGGTNVAVGLRRLGLEASFLGAVGKDAEGERVVATLQREGVNLSLLQRVEDERTGCSVILGGDDGERSVLVYRGANTKLSAAKVDWDAVFAADAIHLASLHGSAVELLPQIERRLKDYKGRFFFNPGGPQIAKGLGSLAGLLSRCDALFLNRREAEFLTGLAATKRVVDTQRCTLCGTCQAVCPQNIFVVANNHIETQHEERCVRCGECVRACPARAILIEPWTHNMRDMLRKLKGYVAGAVVVTDGAAGVQCYDGERFYALPAFSVRVVDALGAGDGFCAGFEAAVLCGGDLADALLWGAAVGALVTQKVGAKAGLPTKQQLLAFIDASGGSREQVRVFEDGAD